jgi:hypothetical protein
MTAECKIRFPDLLKYDVCFGPTEKPATAPVFFSRYEWRFLAWAILKEAQNPLEGDDGVWSRILETLTRAREVGIVHVR